MKPEVGFTYDVYHIWRGSFFLKVTGIAGGLIDGIIISGRANAFFKHNERRAGQVITIRERLASFRPITPDAATLRAQGLADAFAGL